MLELTFVTNAIGNLTFLPVPLLIVAAIWYLFITSILMVGQRYRRPTTAAASTAAVGRRMRGMSRRQQAILAAGTVQPT